MTYRPDKTPATPAVYHVRYHRDGSPMETCWGCGRDAAVCRSKKPFGTREAVDAAVLEIHVRENWTAPMARYRCRWCLGWHVSHVRPSDKRGMGRFEKARRKVLVEDLEALRSQFGGVS